MRGKLTLVLFYFYAKCIFGSKLSVSSSHGELGELSIKKSLLDTIPFPETELNALFELYNTTGGSKWRWDLDYNFFGYPWNFTSDANPCEDLWQGINCTDGTSGIYHITVIHLSGRNMTGQISNSLDQLPNLKILDFDDNQLTGTIPTTISNLTQLQTLSVFSNFFTGTIPEFIYGMIALRYLNLGDNGFNGTISPSIRNLTQLESLSLHICSLTGIIPEAVMELTELRYLNLGSNLLTGPLSSSIGNLRNLTALLLYVNALSSTIPHSLGELVLLQDLDLGANAFHGTLPPALGNLTHIRQFFVDSNALTGTVPPSLQYLTDMRYFYLRYNNFEGSLPAWLGEMRVMREIIVYKNHFTGTIPATLSNWVRAEYVSFGNNLLEGTLPAFFGAMRDLQYLHLDANHLTGTVPPEYGQFERLQELLIYSNQLHGTLPTVLSNLSTLEVFLVQYNRFEGGLQGVFNASTQTVLTTLKLNNNQLTGPLVSELFNLPRVSVLVAGSNCFSGSIPDNVCWCDTLTTLSLDGLSSASTCRRAVLPAISNSYLINDAFSTTLLPCLFNMTALNTLHLSGIGMTGSLPDVPINAEMADLTVSHNYLEGTIPVSFQVFPWYMLDLSYNKLGGTLKKGFTTGRKFHNTENSSASSSGSEVPDLGGGESSTNGLSAGYKFILSLENNRLSGHIPESIHHLVNISILGSNLFSCHLGGTDLPTHDDGSRNYQCGSDSFNVPYYAWLVLVSVVCVLAIVVYYGASRLVLYVDIHDVISNVWMWYAALEINLNLQHSQLRDRLQMLRVVNAIWDLLARTSATCCMYSLLVLLPVYAAMSVYQGTMVHQYSYSVSAAFLSGTSAAVVEFVFFVGLIALFLVIFINNLSTYRKREEEILREVRKSRQSANVSVVAADDSFYLRNLRNAGVYAVFAVINFSVVVGVNVAYVYAVIYKDSNILLLAQLALAFFKVLWNGAGCGYLVQCASHFLREDQRVNRKSATDTQFIMLQVFITLLNNIAVPCIVVAVVSPACFSSLFVSAPVVSTPYTYQLCLNLFDGFCVAYETVNSVTTYEPSYAYSYQCSSSIITYYAPAFVYLCLVTTFLAPLLQVLAQQGYKRSVPGTYTHRALHIVVPRIMRPLSFDPANEIKLAQYGYMKPYFHVNRLLILLITYFGLLLTFGAVFPPLAAALTVSILSLIYFHKLKVGRFLCQAVEHQQLGFIDLFEAECQRAGAVAVLRRSAWLVVVCCCCFYALFLFDTLGDAVGYDDSYWVLIVVPLLPVLSWVVYKMVLFNQGTEESKQRKTLFGMSEKMEGDVEMEPVREFTNPARDASVDRSAMKPEDTYNILH